MNPIGLPTPAQDLGTGSDSEAIIGSGVSIPPGVESIIEFNNLFMNDRSWIDTYLVTSIGGLEDADVRDDRDVNPQDDGETAFDAYYGGRTITLGGSIRAFNLHKLRDMQAAMKQAFSDISQEQQLIFHRVDNPAASCLVYCKKNAPIQMTEEQTTENYFKRDFLITLRASDFRFLALYSKSSTVQLGEADEFNSEDSLDDYDKPTGGSTLGVSGGVMTVSSTSRKRMIRNDLDLTTADNEVCIKYNPDATFTSSAIRPIVKYIDDDNFIYARIDASGNLSFRRELAGSDAAVTGGITWDVGSASVPSRSGGSPYWIRARIYGDKIEVEHATEDPRVNPAAITNSGYVVLTGGEATTFGSGVIGQIGLDFMPGSVNWTFDSFTFNNYRLASEEILLPENLGNYKAKPVIRMGGIIEDAVLTNGANGDQLILEEAIPSDDNIEFDIANQTMKDSSGANKFGILDVESEWMTLAPGVNQILLSGSKFEPYLSGGEWLFPYVSISHRDAYL